MCQILKINNKNKPEIKNKIRTKKSKPDKNNKQYENKQKNNQLPTYSSQQYRGVFNTFTLRFQCV